jgi:hypothetical protein
MFFRRTRRQLKTPMTQRINQRGCWSAFSARRAGVFNHGWINTDGKGLRPLCFVFSDPCLSVSIRGSFLRLLLPRQNRNLATGGFCVRTARHCGCSFPCVTGAWRYHGAL